VDLDLQFEKLTDYQGKEIKSDFYGRRKQHRGLAKKLEDRTVCPMAYGSSREKRAKRNIFGVFDEV
jgi:hypothetical protein